MSKPELHIVRTTVAANSVIIEHGDHRTIVTEHPDEIYLAFGNARGSQAMFHDARRALEIAAILTEYAGRIIERQFARQLGGS